MEANTVFAVDFLQLLFTVGPVVIFAAGAAVAARYTYASRDISGGWCWSSIVFAFIGGVFSVSWALYLCDNWPISEPAMALGAVIGLLFGFLELGVGLVYWDDSYNPEIYY